MAMNDNLAREINMQAIPKPVQQPEYQPGRVHTKKTVKRGITRLEIWVISFFGVVLFGLLVANITMAMQLSTTNRAAQDLRDQSAEIQTVNENLEQNIQELSRYDRVYEIAENNGLKMNEDQIRNVTP
ncbi:cell division protein FtsL [Marinilactibacillus sp. 15R]|uniref:Cell division protein FtsL n=1 Tax=Marinilactibacillus piezotolerans TaxID=258723 RepID=A0A1I3ZBW4_9LACT|nr:MULTISPECIES: cell division protein FtsL [Marinilactibacillus]API89146.1 cell division protein FtsL [Marinilactibacillus sp. 15R]SFK41076.1 cell division protein FtsL [Marinilactibacillus piezotolerans]